MARAVSDPGGDEERRRLRLCSLWHRIKARPGSGSGRGRGTPPPFSSLLGQTETRGGRSIYLVAVPGPLARMT